MSGGSHYGPDTDGPNIDGPNIDGPGADGYSEDQSRPRSFETNEIPIVPPAAGRHWAPEGNAAPESDGTAEGYEDPEGHTDAADVAPGTTGTGTEDGFLTEALPGMEGDLSPQRRPFEQPEGYQPRRREDNPRRGSRRSDRDFFNRAPLDTSRPRGRRRAPEPAADDALSDATGELPPVPDPVAGPDATPEAELPSQPEVSLTQQGEPIGTHEVYDSTGELPLLAAADAGSEPDPGFDHSTGEAAYRQEHGESAEPEFGGEDGDGLIGIDRLLPDEDAEGGNSRRSRRVALKSNRTRRRRSATVLLSSLALLLVIVIVGAFGVAKVRSAFSTPDYEGSGTGSVEITVSQGDSATAIGQTLEKAQVVKSVTAFIDAAGANAESSSIQPGEYRLRKQMKATAALTLLLDPSSRVNSGGITLPEGLSLDEALVRISKTLDIPKSDLLKAASDPHKLGVPSWASPIKPEQAKAVKLPDSALLEGFLYPAQYQFKKNASATTVLSTMVAETVKRLNQLNFTAAAKKVNLSPYEALTVASAVQREGIPKDFGKIARVIYNREKQSMPWGLDSTVNFITQSNKLNLSNKDLSADSPYNTRKYKGFPPTPISAPGDDALKAAIDPTPGPWLYFVAVDKSGNSAFATTLTEHNKNIARAKKNGVF